MTRIAVVQPALALGRVEENLRRVEQLVHDAHREHSPDVVVLPEGCTSPNVFAPEIRAVPRPLDPARPPLQTLLALARELDCVIAGGFLAVREEHAHGSFVLVEPDGTWALHDKDIPTAWEQHFYTGGEDDGVVGSGALGARVGLMSGWEWARTRTAARVRAAGVGLVLGGMCWPSMPLNWGGPLGPWVRREHALWRRQARELPAQVARIVGAPVAHAAHVGPVRGRTPLMPGLAWHTEMLGESQVCDREGNVLARLTLEDGESHASAEVALGAGPAAQEQPSGYWIPSLSAASRLAFHAMNAHGALAYRRTHSRGRFPWQAAAQAGGG